MGAHTAMTRLMRAPTPLFFLALVLATVSSFNMLPLASPDETSDALLKFKASLGPEAEALNWGLTPKPCNGDTAIWFGVICLENQVNGLQLENMQLGGSPKFDSLAALPFLKTIRLRNDSFEGPLPNLSMLTTIRWVYLTSNKFSGEIPDDAFEGLSFLRRVNLGRNEFLGRIPKSLAGLPRVREVEIGHNKFSGKIPDFKSELLESVDVSYNDLSGEIPESLRTMDAHLFAGNPNLCGEPTGAACPSPTPSPSPSPDFEFTPSPLVLKLALGAMSILLILLIISFIVIFAKKRNQTSQPHDPQLSNTAGTTSQKLDTNVEAIQISHPVIPTRRGGGGSGGGGGVQGKLLFVKSERERFDLHDLLRASAEILGSGNFGASYKALILTDCVVVKRYKQMNNVGREDFHEHMRRIGKLSHANLLPLVAYYYRREEKLLVSDYVENSSLASHLHGNHNKQLGLDWRTRLRIIKGIGRGLTYLHETLPNIVAPHGHLKSSNVLLDEDMNPLLNDYALLPVINLDRAQQLIMANKSPEYAKRGHVSKKTDVWCFGICILEVLTGRFPENYVMAGYDSKADLATWVNGMINEKRTSEVFDVDMGDVGNSKGEVLKMLRIGVSCCEEDVERRAELGEVVAKIEELNEGESDGDYSSESDSSSEGGGDN